MEIGVMFLIAFVILGVLGILMVNLFITSKNLLTIISHCFKINSLDNYWKNVWQANLNIKSIYSSIISFFLALLIYILIFPVIFVRKYFFITKNKNKDYFSSIKKETVSIIIKNLRKKLPKKPTRNNYQIPLKRILTSTSENSLSSNLQKAADEMCSHLLINKKIKIVTIDNIDAGKFESLNGINTIYINGNFVNQSIRQKFAILAHEMTHYYLHLHKIKKNNTNDNELLTEICSVFLGFGLIMLNGYDYYNSKNEKQYSKVGYVDSKIILEAIIQTAIIRKQNPYSVINELGFPLKLMVRIKLRKLVSEYTKFKK